MSTSRETYSKKENEKKRQQKKKEKAERKAARKMDYKKGRDLDEMMAYVDEFGNLTSTPLDYKNKKEASLDEIQISTLSEEQREEVPLQKGKVKYFNEDKGFGFIKDQNSGADIFFHVNSLIHAVELGDRVQYKTTRGLKGMEASEITKL